MQENKTILELVENNESIENYIEKINTEDFRLFIFFYLFNSFLLTIFSYSMTDGDIVHKDFSIIYVFALLIFFLFLYKKDKRKKNILRYMSKNEYKKLSKSSCPEFYLDNLISKLNIEDLNNYFEKIMDNIKSEELKNVALETILNELSKKGELKIEYEFFIKSKYIKSILEKYCSIFKLNIINEFIKIEEKIENKIESIKFLNLKYEILTKNLSNYLELKEFDNLEKLLLDLDKIKYNDKYVYLLKGIFQKNDGMDKLLNELNNKMVNNF